MLIMKHPKSRYETLIRFFNDKTFELMQEVVLNIETYYAIVSVDRRTKYEQDKSRFIVFCSDRPSSNKLVKLNFKDKKCDSENILYSKEPLEEKLHSCHTVKNGIIIAFHAYSARFYDKNLILTRYAKWPALVNNLMSYGVASNHSDWGETGWIIICCLHPDIQKVPCKSICDKQLANVIP